MDILSIATSFSVSPGGRNRSDGPFSGEQFREEHLEKKIEKGEKFIVDLDGTFGYATSFLEESFGGLARKYGKEKVLKIITFVSEEDPSLIEVVKSYIENANQ